MYTGWCSRGHPFSIADGTLGITNGNPGCPSCDPNQKLTDYLWEKTRPLQELALQTEFIQAILSGMLDPEAFGV